MSTLLSLNSLSTAPIQPNSIDFSDDVVSPQNKFGKNPLKTSHFASVSVSDTVSNTLTTLPDDLQSKLVFMTTEINGLVDTNLQLTKELDVMKSRCKEAEKLIGKSATITLDKKSGNYSNKKIIELEHVIDQLTYELSEAQENINVKDRELIDLKRKRVEVDQENNENNRRSLRDITLKENIEKRANESGSKSDKSPLKRSQKKPKRPEVNWEEKCGLMEFEVERLNTLLEQKEEEIDQLKENSSNLDQILFEKDQLDIELQVCKNTLETYKNEIELLCVEIIRLRQKEAADRKESSLSRDRNILNTEDGRMNTYSLETEESKEGKFTSSGKQIDLGFARSLPASTGDEALSVRESVIEERLSEHPLKMDSIKETARFVETKKTEVDFLKEEIMRLKRAILEYEEVIKVWSRELQGIEKDRKTKQAIEKKLTDQARQMKESEKRLSEVKATLKQREDEIKNLTMQNSELSREMGQMKLGLQDELGSKLSSGLTNQRWTTSLLEEISEEPSFREIWAEEKERLITEIKKYELTVMALEKEQKKLAQVMKENIQLQKEKKDIMEKEVSEYDLELLREKEKMEEEAERERGFYIQEIERLESIVRDLRDQVEQEETKILELTEENLRLNKLAVENIREIEELKNKYTSDKETQAADLKNKFLKSYVELEEIAVTLEAKKNSMQTQLDQMKEIIEAGYSKIKDLKRINRKTKEENKILTEELERLKRREEVLLSLGSESKLETS